MAGCVRSSSDNGDDGEDMIGRLVNNVNIGGAGTWVGKPVGALSYNFSKEWLLE